MQNGTIYLQQRREDKHVLKQFYHNGKFFLRFARSCQMSFVAVSEELTICFLMLLDIPVCSQGMLHPLTTKTLLRRRKLAKPSPRCFEYEMMETMTSVIGGKAMLHHWLRVGRSLLSASGLCSSRRTTYLFAHEISLQVLPRIMGFMPDVS